MKSRFNIENFYSTNTTSQIDSGLATDSAEHMFSVAVPPASYPTYISINTSDETKRDIIYIHNIVGSTLYYYNYNRSNYSSEHVTGAVVSINDVAQNLNFLNENIDDFGQVKLRTGLNVSVKGGNIIVNGTEQNISDTELLLEDNDTNYIVYDYKDNTIKSIIDDLDLVGYKLSTITTSGGECTNILEDRRHQLNYIYNEEQFNIVDGKLSIDTSTGLTDKTVKISANDTTAGVLNGKLVAGDNITLTEGNDGGDETLTIATTGEANTISNIGTTGTNLFKQKVGVDLEIKKINSVNSGIVITDDTGNDKIDIELTEGNIDLNNCNNTNSNFINSAQAPVQSVAGNTGVVTLDKTDVGLSNVDNTSDATKNNAVAVITNKNLASGTNTFPIFNQDTTGKSGNSNAINSATTIINTSLAIAPSIGQVLTATSSTNANWQTPSGGSSGGNGPIISGVIAGTQIIADILEIPVSKTITAGTFRVSLGTLPTGSDFICKLYKNGVEDASCTIATTETLTNGLYQTTDISFVSGSYTAGDVLKVSITQIGSTIAGSNFTFSLTE